MLAPYFAFTSTRDSECIPLGIEEIALPAKSLGSRIPVMPQSPKLPDDHCRVIKFHTPGKQTKAFMPHCAGGVVAVLQQSARDPPGLNLPGRKGKLFYFVKLLPPQDLGLTLPTPEGGRLAVEKIDISGLIPEVEKNLWRMSRKAEQLRLRSKSETRACQQRQGGSPSRRRFVASVLRTAALAAPPCHRWQTLQCNQLEEMT